jgi:hypothetical protein
VFIALDPNDQLIVNVIPEPALVIGKIRNGLWWLAGQEGQFLHLTVPASISGLQGWRSAREIRAAGAPKQRITKGVPAS